MSITSCFLVFLLCLSLYASTSRRLPALHNENKHQNQLHVSTKNNDGRQKLPDAEVMYKTVESQKEKTSGAIGTSKAVVSVSWRVPHRKHGEKHPGFNLDYSPPKTHPPSHN
ncbi:Ubiquitin-like superfamily protein isoform 1 [Hibiscus syriacus]|uniref:Ubiquitin-like superfamily protein isoform 1 n=1 Tax=Hibiscus syriacus TaxID=106335 RepID=A0A6A3C9M9_HIBSY|nr:Ubiquitin-like superfamily protein isoform 1 [Hibiscus syriacus]